MPTVKVWSPQVDTQALPTPSGSSGGGVDVLTQGIRDVGNTITKVWEQNQLDQVTKAETDFQARLNDVQDRVQLSKGLDSVVAAGDAKVELEKTREQLGQGFQSPAARNLFMARSGALMEGTRRQVQDYVARQREEQTTQTFVARKVVGLNAIARSAFDDNAFGTQLAALESIVNADEAVKGRPHAEGAPDENVHPITVARREEVRQLAVAARLNALIGSESPGGIAKAQEVLEANRAMLGDQVGQFEGKLRFLAKDQRTEQLAMEITTAALDERQRVNASQALAAVDAFTGSAEDKKSLREKVDHRIAQSEAAFKQRQDTLSSSAFTAGLNPRTGLFSFDAVPPETKARLAVEDPAKLADLRHRSDADRDRLRNQDGRETPEERRTWGKLLIDMADDPEKFRQMSDEAFNAEWGSRLGPNGYRDGIVRLSGLHKVQADKVATVQTPESVLLNEGRASGAWPKGEKTSWSSEELLRFNDATTALATKLNGYKDPKAIAPELVTGFARDIVAKGTVAGQYFGRNDTTAIQAQREGRSDFVPTILDADRKRVVAKFKLAGRPVPSDDAIRAILAEELRLREATR